MLAINWRGANGQRWSAAWRLLLLCLGVQVLQLLDFGVCGPAVPIYMDKNLIAQQNDSAYVAQIMRLAKSAEMRSLMQPEADVCENFYEYACGSWPRLNPADTMEKRKTSIFDLLDSSYKHKQLRLLGEMDPSEMDMDAESREQDEEQQQNADNPNAAALRKVKDFYKSCRQMSEAQKPQVVQEMHKIIEEFGSMPALLEQQQGPDAVWPQEENFDCFRLLGEIQHRYGFDIILQLGLRPDFENRTQHTLFIGQPALKLKTKSVYTGVATAMERQRYRQEIAENLENFLGLEAERAETVAQEILNFEISLSHGLFDLSTKMTWKSKATKRTKEELSSLYGENMNFLVFLETTLGYPLNVTCYEYTTEYHEGLQAVLAHTPKRQVANYIMYQLVEPFFIGYDRPFRDMDEVCLERTKKFFNHILDNAIFGSFNSVEVRRDILTIWQEIKQTFRTQMALPKMEWLTPLSRKLALEKLERIQLHINSYGNRNFSQEYEDLTVQELSYVQNLKNVNHLRVIRFLQHLSGPGKLEWGNHQLSHSPAYISSENVILIPVSLLQPNYLWSDYYPKALKFGTLGFLLAHELIHGFDDIGQRPEDSGADAAGASWWDETSARAFRHKKSCLRNQYARFRFNGRYLPKSELQSENIADNAAVQLAFKSYIHWLNLQSLEYLEELLPNIKLNNKKLFFLSFAQFFCVDVNAVIREKVSLLDVHAPAKFRVIGPLANFPEFAKTFKCPLGSTMNPERKCEVY